MQMALPLPTAIDAGRIEVSDLTYSVTTEREIAPLVRSIEKVGLLNPPVLVSRGKRWAVVAGFRRLRAAGRLGISSIDCRPLPGSTSPLACAKIAIADNTGQRRLNTVELSRAYRLLSERLPHPSHLPEAAESVGLPASPEWIEKVAGLCRMPEMIQQAVIEDRIALPTAAALASLAEKEAAALAVWFVSAPLSLNRQRELLTLVREIARREDRTLLAVLETPELAGIVKNPEMDPAQKGRELRHRLRKRRFPMLSRAEETFEQRRRRLPLPTGMALLPPKHFEGSRFELKLTFEKAEDLEKMLAAAGKVAKSPALAEILGEENGNGKDAETGRRRNSPRPRTAGDGSG